MMRTTTIDDDDDDDDVDVDKHVRMEFFLGKKATWSEISGR